ncbi:chorion peroxidase-like [Pollicipes pollicipes]|uniref:chorion peroxidase-like n=1 Tax=Pollicipes pollicipes TaxID=41117 RepID=UPI0018857331|nr:chorion peroxidase-like [Pollicipes pollicipes]
MHDTAVLGSHARKVNVTRLLTEQRLLEAQLLAEGRVPQPNSAAYKQMLNALSTDEAQELGRAGLRQSLTLCGCSGLRDNSTGNVTQGADRSPHPAVHLPYCEPEPVPLCQRSRPFRTSDGECNNLMHPRWGRALTGLGRLLPNTYDDGLFRSVESDAASAALVAFGQFLAHDTIQTPVYRINAHTGLQCCGADGSAPPTPPVHPQCFPIEVAADDPFYGTLGRRCLNLVRSLFAPDPACEARPAAQLNALTAYLDGSAVYGVDHYAERRLPSVYSEPDPVPGAKHQRRRAADSACHAGCVGCICFDAGDNRVNEQPPLALLHTLWVREHNRVAAALVRRHPHAGDEWLFQTARKVTVAELQHVTHNEFLPSLLGLDFSLRHGLLPLREGFSTFYDDEVSAELSVEFTTAAFRHGHSQVQNDLWLASRSGDVAERYLVPELFAPSLLLPAQRVDGNSERAVFGDLFRSQQPSGLDLPALNVQRGPRPRPRPLIPEEDVTRLRTVYSSPRDVDLYIGGLLERHATGAQVGPTFQCIIGDAFFRLRFGDRFFYDNGELVHSFSPVQLREVRHTSLARLLCDTLGPLLPHVTPLAFSLPSAETNPAVKCDSLAVPEVDLSVF